MNIQFYSDHLPFCTGFPGGASGKGSICQCRKCKRCGFDPWVRKIPCSKKWQPTPVFSPGIILWAEKPGWLQSMGSQLDTTKHECPRTHTPLFILPVKNSVISLPLMVGEQLHFRSSEVDVLMFNIIWRQCVCNFSCGCWSVRVES